MPALRDIEQSVKLEDGASFVGLYDPTKEVGVTENERGWTRYKFRFLQDDGRIVAVSGGTRLYDEIIKACGTSDKPRRLKVTAHGKAGDINRTFAVVEVAPGAK